MCTARVCICSKPDMNGISGCSRFPEHAQVNFTVCNTLDTVHLCCPVHLRVHSALLVRDFQVLLRSGGVFHLNSYFQVEIKVSSGEHSNSVIYE